MKWLPFKLFVFISLFYLRVDAQQYKMGLQDAINVAKQYSLDYQFALHSYEYNNADFKSFIANRYPSLDMRGTFPNYTRSIGLITLPNGEPLFVGQDQAYSNLSLNLSQKVTPTGGILTLSSAVNRVDIFGSNRNITYSSVPLTISYMQNMIGYNAYKWQQKIALAKVEAARKNLLQSSEDVSLTTVGYYFEMLQIASALHLAEQNYTNADTLYKISLQRFALATVGKSELLQLQLNLLNTKNTLLQDSINYTVARKRFLEYLTLPDATLLQLNTPDDITFFAVDMSLALQEANNNSKTPYDNQLSELEARQQVAEVQAQNSVNFNINTSFGLTRAANQFHQLYNELQQQRNLGVTFSVPILNWGYNRIQKQKSLTNLATIQTRNKRSAVMIEQDVYNCVSKWNFQQQLLAAATTARKIAIQRYDLEKERYLYGNITLNDFNIAQQQKDEASTRYIDVLKGYWEIYYTLRKLTLYDFSAHRQLK